MSNPTLNLEQFIRVSPAEVSHALTNASAMRYWLCDIATVDPRPGGRIYLAWNSGYYSAGQYTVIDPGRQIGFTWFGRDDPGRSQVTIRLEAQDGGTHLTLVHTLPDTGENWREAGAQIEKGWRDSLENLASVLETGQDLRLVNRPMIGITFGDFNPEIAAELGVPVTQGVRLDTIIEGMGAHSAGLREGDVVIQMGNVPIQTFTDLPVAVSGKRAGDAIPVTFYRGAEKVTVNMILSRRQLPAIPATTVELAQALRKRYDEVEAALEQVFAEVSEEAAGFRSAPGEWTAKEVLAHLILGERFNIQRIYEVAAGFESWTDDWGGNSDAQVCATVAAFPTLIELIDELKRLHRENVAFFEILPSEFSRQNRAGFWSLAYGAVEAPYHLYGHREQIEKAIAEARGEPTKVES